MTLTIFQPGGIPKALELKVFQTQNKLEKFLK